MGETELLILVFFGVHVLEGLVWVRDDDLLVMSWTGFGGRVFRPGIRLKNPLLFGYAFRFRRDPEKPSFDAEALDARWEGFRRTTRLLTWLSRALLIALASCAVLPYRGPVPPWAWLALGGTALVLHAAIAPCFWRAHAALYPARSGERIVETAVCLLSPWGSLRAVDTLSRALLAGFHPAVAAVRIADREAALDLVKTYLFEISYPAKTAAPSDDAAIAGAEAGKREFLRWMTASGFEAAELLRPPERGDPAGRSYCERCRLDYVLSQGECAECGRALVAYPAGP